ncbi:putative membrane transporter protein YfcA [Sinobacterium norvegicum]|uniref:Probable membrane transporter protein n=1 Tax=Sinobacterium norvegicum TaxID=1641715 RepID=A0ABN8EN57_9GAMM|nr:TSUP family transporter [Sinobacterium norvegicum]CAH0992377.1 putative membrane transporter protein YfcA [Sinobacterium norvegicum]
MLTLFSLLGFISGFLNAIAGGGGLITLPILLWAGLPPLQALATNKCQSVFGTLSSSLHFFQQGFIDLKHLAPAMILVVVVSAASTWGVQQLPDQALQQLLPYALIGIALYTWLSPHIGDSDHPARVSHRTFTVIAGCGVGFYGGFFGPGMGAVTALLIASLLGYNLSKATANAKPLVLLSNLSSLVVFIGSGHVLWTIGLTMAFSQIIGARIGSTVVIHHGSRVIKPLLLLVTIAIAINLLLNTAS